ncbi:MAG: hypothetical protein ACLQBX_10100 [Candidatus Limnocylindrales bacterium]
MSEPSFEDAIRSMLRSAAPVDVPVSLEHRALAIPSEMRTPGGWRRAGLTLRGPVGALAAVLVVVALVAIVVLPRPVTAPNSGTTTVNSIGVTTIFGTFSASDFELIIGDRSFTDGPSGWSRPSSSAGLDVSFTGSADFGSFELHWIEHAAPMTLVAYFAANAHDWWVSEIVASEGRPDGKGWLYFEGLFFERPLGSPYRGEAALTSSRSTDGLTATLRFGRLDLRAFEAGSTPRDPTKGTMPPVLSGGGIVDESSAPDYIAVAGPSGAIAGYAPRALLLAIGSGPMNGYVGEPPDVPVYAADLRTLVGYVVSPGGFVPLADFAAKPAATSTPPASSVPATLMPGELVLATSGSANAGGGGTLLTGVLGGEVRGDHACLWLAPSDAPTTRVALVWPPGYHAYNDPPLQINAPDNRVIALAGATMSLNGVWIEPGTGPTSDRDPCGIDSIFVVSGVVANGGAVTPVTVAMPSARP